MRKKKEKEEKEKLSIFAISVSGFQLLCSRCLFAMPRHEIQCKVICVYQDKKKKKKKLKLKF